MNTRSSERTIHKMGRARRIIKRLLFWLYSTEGVLC